MAMFPFPLLSLKQQITVSVTQYAEASHQQKKVDGLLSTLIDHG